MRLHPHVEDALKVLAGRFDVLECDPDLADTVEFCAHYGIDPADSANTIVVVSKRPSGSVAACVVLATTRLDVNSAVCRTMGVKKASFASADATVELTGMEIGGVTPFGLDPSIPVLVDAAVMERSEIVLGGGNRSSKLKIGPELLTTIPNARIVDGLARSTPA
jgi:prolyl-tRNA editing enzyme YbaK/EbsC (Cys-tRNA(Pro) deacylase)